MTRIASVQKALKAPKGQYNSFGKYHYRSCEDILEAAKPLCCDNGIVLTVSDELVLIGERYYIKATATLHDTDSPIVVSNTAYARESADKKGMDECQITGTASSYARKYALNGLFCIDDTKDADTDEYMHQNSSNSRSTASKAAGKMKDTSTEKPAQIAFKCSVCECDVKSIKKADGTVVPADVVYSSCGNMCYSCYANKNSKGA